jgi:hypothetical protein
MRWRDFSLHSGFDHSLTGRASVVATIALSTTTGLAVPATTQKSV